MLRRFIIALAVTALLPAAARLADASPAEEAGARAEAGGAGQAGEGGEAAPPDDTGRNVRDREGGTLTPFDQGGSESDLRITQEIRKALVGDDDLSTNAKNVKVITIDGVVTLRGPVESTEERETIAAVAQRTPGVQRVDNQIEVDAD